MTSPLVLGNYLDKTLCKINFLKSHNYLDPLYTSIYIYIKYIYITYI